MRADGQAARAEAGHAAGDAGCAQGCAALAEAHRACGLRARDGCRERDVLALHHAGARCGQAYAGGALVHGLRKYAGGAGGIARIARVYGRQAMGGDSQR